MKYLLTLLLIPLSLLATGWPIAPQDESHPMGNNWGEFQDYGGGAYFHNGSDVFPMSTGAPVYAVAHGWVKGWGTITANLHWRLPICDSALTFTGRATGWLYAHIDSTRWHKQVGDEVNTGDLIGYLVDFSGFQHCHFARISDTGATWNRFPNPTWWFIQDPLSIIAPNSDTFKPRFEYARSSNRRFGFCLNNTTTYRSDTNLYGDVDIIARIYDKVAPLSVGNSIYDRLVPQQIEYLIRGRYASAPRTLGVTFKYVLPPSGTPEVNVIYKHDQTCHSQGDYDNRYYYFIVTNTDGDSSIEMTDTTGKWATASFPDDYYWVKVFATDAAGNWWAESMQVRTRNNNPIRDVACTVICQPPAIVDSGTVVTPACSVYNYGPTLTSSYQVRMKIGASYEATATVTNHGQGARVYVTFPSWTAEQLGNLAVSCSTELASDMLRDNDRKTGSCYVRGTGARDVGCFRILAPVDTIDSTATVAPACSVFNYGATMESYQVRMKVGSFYNATAQVNGHLAGTAAYATFPSRAAWPRGSQAVSCSTELALDASRANDKQTALLAVRVRDVGPTLLIAPTGTIDSPTVVTPACSLRNFGTSSESYSVRMRIGSSYNLTASVTGHAPLATVAVTFPDWTATLVGGPYPVRCSTELATDMRKGNDTLGGSVTVRRPAIHDVSCLKIMAPAGTIDSGTVVAPACSVYNYGNQTEAYSVRMKIGSGYDLTASVTGHAPLATVAVTFPSWTARPVGTLTASCSTELAGDQQGANNRQADAFYVRPVTTIDVGCTRLIAPSGTVDSGAVVAPACSVYNYGSATETYSVRMRIGTGYNSTAQVASHDPATAAYVTFPSWTARSRGDCTPSCSTELAGDGFRDNDRKTGSAFVQVLDVGAISIMAPTGAVDSGAVVVPSAVVRNYGNTEQSFDVELALDDGYARTLNRTVGPGADSILYFPDWTAGARGMHAVTCSTELAGDMIAGNNGATTSVWVIVHDVGAVAVLAPSGSILPGSVTPQAVVHNYGSQREALDVFFAINSAPPYMEVVNLLDGLPTGLDTTIAFPDWNAITPRAYTARCSVALWNDQVPSNDVAWTGFSVGRIDIGVTEIVGPAGDIDSGAVVRPSARVKNYGDFAASFTAWFRFDTAGGGVYSDNVAIADLPAGRESTVVFAEWAKPHQPQNYTTRCSTYLAGDANAANDTLDGSFRVTVIRPVTGWTQKADVPTGPKGKRVKDGGSLAYTEGGAGGQGSGAGDDPTGYIYALKGNNRLEFYQYDIAANTWAAKESIPAVGRAGKKKAVKKGSALAALGGKVFGMKGNNTLEFWGYTPGSGWTQLADVPAGAKNVKEGTGAVAVQLGDTTYIYFLKGSGTQEFYRYSTLSNTWQPMATAPAGLSGKPFKNGSCLATDGTTIWALKGSYNEFFAYDIAFNTWTTKTSLPLIGSSGRKKKVKDGAGIAYLNGNWGLSHGFRPTKSGTVPEFARSAGCLYALKGGNTQEFWKYVADSDRWIQKEDMPLGGGKRVKGGGALVTGGSVLFALKGNNTFEFWQYTPGAMTNDEGRMTNTMTDSRVRTSALALRTSPNPFSRTTTISYSLPEPGVCRLSLYDITGKLTATLSEGYAGIGTRNQELRTENLSRGVYVLELETGDYRTTQKLILE
jgi:hypothetical protein